MDSFIKSSNCFSKRDRIRGNSDECVQQFLDLIFEIGENDPLNNFNDYNFISICKTIFYDDGIFTPIDSNGKIVGKSITTTLPNGIYRKLVIYVILNIESFTQNELQKLITLFMALEENNITGFMYISRNGRAIEPIMSVISKYSIVPQYGWFIDYANNKKNPENGLIICNTVVVSLIIARLL
jgi:hypothetical protein